jgi:hypothetical protein
MTHNKFVQFMVSPLGRLFRVVSGIVIIAAGLVGIGGTAGNAVAVIGLFPLVGGMLDVCVLGPLFGCSFSGRRVRHEG